MQSVWRYHTSPPCFALDVYLALTSVSRQSTASQEGNCCSCCPSEASSRTFEWCTSCDFFAQERKKCAAKVVFQPHCSSDHCFQRLQSYKGCTAEVPPPEGSKRGEDADLNADRSEQLPAKKQGVKTSDGLLLQQSAKPRKSARNKATVDYREQDDAAMRVAPVPPLPCTLRRGSC